MLNYQGSRDGPSRKEALGEPLCMKWRLMAHAIWRFHSSIRTCICVEERRLIVESREKGLTV